MRHPLPIFCTDTYSSCCVVVLKQQVAPISQYIACCRVIAKGTVAEEGTHESLAEGGGIYSALVGASSAH